MNAATTGWVIASGLWVSVLIASRRRRRAPDLLSVAITGPDQCPRCTRHATITHTITQPTPDGFTELVRHTHCLRCRWCSHDTQEDDVDDA